MSTRPMECGYCGMDHHSGEPCPTRRSRGTSQARVVQIMETSINGASAPWPAAIWRLWNTFADACDPKLTVLTVKSANYFTPRPYVDQYNRGSGEEGFIYTLSRPISVNQVIIARHPIALDSPEHPFEPVQHQTGCARCGYARGHHPATRARSLGGSEWIE